MTSHMGSRPPNMDDDVWMVERKDQERYGRRYELQTAISAGRAYI